MRAVMRLCSSMKMGDQLEIQLRRMEQQVKLLLQTLLSKRGKIFKQKQLLSQKLKYQRFQNGTKAIQRLCSNTKTGDQSEIQLKRMDKQPMLQLLTQLYKREKTHQLKQLLNKMLRQHQAPRKTRLKARKLILRILSH